jgi:hypothetical protein
MITADTKRERLFALALIVLGVAARLLPHAQNFTPVTALALFAGVTLPPALALTVPLAVMVSSDIVIGPHDLAVFTWGSFVLVGVLGAFLRAKARPWTLLAGTLAGSVLFFAVTNFGVFLYGGLYPRTVQGFVDCYVLALPFFRNSVLGDLFFSAALFGTFAAVKARVFKPLSSRAS